MGNLFAPLNLKAYDALFYIRAKIPETRLNAPIAMVEIDDRTFEDKAFRIPMILWHHYFAEVIKGLTDSRARVICCPGNYLMTLRQIIARHGSGLG
ncbi:CHASE2 domain-containing protein [Desulfonema magnum]|uniref:CHASE2 domain-containing protein n=1 Tax=Desulfonema magnum TaxID=45655 RepID=UPI001A9B551B|nr:CHASE2 domain-containing protein [Desulfonema magnum]